MMIPWVFVPVAAVSAAGGVDAIVETLHASDHHEYFRFTGSVLGMVCAAAAVGQTILKKCLGWNVKGKFVLTSIILGFFTVVIFANMDGSSADVIKKCVSWIMGLSILFFWRHE